MVAAGSGHNHQTPAPCSCTDAYSRTATTRQDVFPNKERWLHLYSRRRPACCDDAFRCQVLQVTHRLECAADERISIPKISVLNIAVDTT